MAASEGGGVTFAAKQRKELRAAIAKALREHGNVRDAAKALGMPRSTLHDRAVDYGIKMRPPGRRPAGAR